MNEQLQKSLATILEKATHGVEAGVSFLSAEIPDVAHQLLSWKMAESLYIIFLCVLLLAGSFVAFYKVYKAEEKDILHFFEGGLVVTIFAAITAIISFILLFDYMFVALKIWLAPKIYLIE